MYVDKNSLECTHPTALRLNRIHPDKKTRWCDFVNEAEAIAESFEPYYEKQCFPRQPTRTCSRLETRIKEYGLFDDTEVERTPSAFRRQEDGEALRDLQPASAWNDPRSEQASRARSSPTSVKHVTRSSHSCFVYDVDLGSSTTYLKHVADCSARSQSAADRGNRTRFDLDSQHAADLHRDIELDSRQGRLEPNTKPAKARKAGRTHRTLVATSPSSTSASAPLSDEDKIRWPSGGPARGRRDL